MCAIALARTDTREGGEVVAEEGQYGNEDGLRRGGARAARRDERADDLDFRLTVLGIRSTQFMYYVLPYVD